MQLGVLAERSTHSVTLTVPYLVSRHLGLYTDVFANHPPLITWFLAGLYRVADPLVTLRVLNVLYVLGTGALVFWAGRRLWETPQALAAILFYLTWATYHNLEFFYPDGLVGTTSALLILLATLEPSGPILLLVGVVAGLGAALKPSAVLLLGAPALWLLGGDTAGGRPATRRQVAAGTGVALLTYLAPMAVLMAGGAWPMARRALFNAGNVAWVLELTNLFDGNAWRTMALTLGWLPAFALIGFPGAGPLRTGPLLGLVFGMTVVLNYPSPGYHHLMACLPAVALMSGAVIGSVLERAAPLLRAHGWRHALARSTPADRAAVGLAAGLAAATLVSALTPLYGAARGDIQIVGWDELRPVSQWLVTHTRPDDRVLVLPIYDTTGNVYAQAARLPAFYMKMHRRHLRVPENATLLQTRILADPPAVIVLFPDLYREVGDLLPVLNAYVSGAYREAGRIGRVPRLGPVVFLTRLEAR